MIWVNIPTLETREDTTGKDMPILSRKATEVKEELYHKPQMFHQLYQQKVINRSLMQSIQGMA